MAELRLNLSTDNDNTKRWYVVILASVTFGLGLGAPTMCMPVLFKEMSAELGLNLVEVGTIWGVVSLGGFMMLLIGGMLGDRFGLKRILTTAIFFSGVAGALRGFACDFFGLVATVFLFGSLSSLLMINMPKVIKVRFSSREFALANGIMATGMALGLSLGAMISATVLSPWLGGWRNVFFLYGVVSIILSVLWFVTVREPEGRETSASRLTVPMRQAISHVSRLRGIWILGFSFFGYQGCVQGVTGYLPLYLQAIGWSAGEADNTLAAFNLAGAFGTIPLALISDRFGVRKAVLFLLLVVSMIGVILLPLFNNEVVWILAIVIGFARDPCMMLFLVMNMESEGVSVVYASTAMGLMVTIARVGGGVAPALGNSLANISIGTPFIFWGTLALVAAVILGFSRETGWKQKRGGI
jgi:ACS family glucarate transporter-like MFS transporter